MLKKTTLASGKKVKVTFELPANGATAVAVVGDFNGWDKQATPLKKRKKDGV
jgi:1,4-alpha-glucan branching enzyme